MKQKIFFLIPFFILSKFNWAQSKQTKFANADFKNAIAIEDSIYGLTNVSLGYGSVLDFKFDQYVREENSAWFKFSIDHDSTLIFDIVPIDSTDDYDFILFKCPNANCINDIRAKKIIPERICYSYNTTKNSTTGLSEYATSTIIGIGFGPAYASALSVKAGETYYLMINNGYDGKTPLRNKFPKGFTIYFYNYYPKKKPVILNNVSFESNKAVLLKESFSELDKLVLRLSTNKTIKIEIRGHTDNTGNEIENQTLSEERAKAVVNYLVSKKIDQKRLLFKGFGSTKSIASNDTEEGRKKNRRVDFVILMH